MHVEYNDRGRGPKISARYIVAADGLPLRTDVTGNDYLKAPVEEHSVIVSQRLLFSLGPQGQISVQFAHRGYNAEDNSARNTGANPG